MERLDYIRHDEERGYLIVQLSGGGACVNFYPMMPENLVIHELRRLADLLEKGVQHRQVKGA